MAHVIRLDLDDLDLDVAHVVLGSYMDIDLATIHFGWQSTATFSSTSPERHERLAELHMEAARDLRIAQADREAGQVRDDRSVA